MGIQTHVHDSGPPYNRRPADEFSATADEVTCRQFVELVTDYFEGALGPRTLTQVEEHLVMCDWCVTYAEQMQATVAMLHELKHEVSEEPAEAVLSALRARKRA